MTIGNLMKVRREEAGISQNELHRRSGVPQRNISYWESGHGKPHVNDCFRLAKGLNMSIANYLTDLTLPEDDD